MREAEAQHLPAGLYSILAGLWLAWGFNWAAIKIAVSQVPPWTFRTLCLGLGSAVLFAVLRGSGQSLVVPRSQWRRLAVLAFFNITCWNLLVAYGVNMIPAGRGAILAYMMPAWAIPLSIWLLGERFTPRKLVGLALGLGGLVLLLADAFSDLGRAPLGSFLVLAASVSWALGTVLQKRYPVSMAPGPYTAWLMFLGGVPIFFGMLAFDDLAALRQVEAGPWIGVAYNVFIAFAFAHWAWIKIATSVPVTVFSLSMLVIPVVGVLSGMLVLGERPSWQEYAALALVLGSLLTVVVPVRQAR
ncbi:MAG: EamA family transporter [Betaproteobacteria bacterium]|nr:EamA family transporter [Betaproteobacteria bacterium]